jgi:hypothetical protein
MLAILFRHFGFIAPKTLNYLAFQYFDFERTWWRLFQKRVVCTKSDIYVFNRDAIDLDDTLGHLIMFCLFVLSFISTTLLLSLMFLVGFLLLFFVSIVLIIFIYNQNIFYKVDWNW